jgi:hypothetical protein
MLAMKTINIAGWKIPALILFSMVALAGALAVAPQPGNTKTGEGEVKVAKDSGGVDEAEN